MMLCSKIKHFAIHYSKQWW